MGNRFSVAFGGGSSRFPFHQQLGTSAANDFSTSMDKKNNFNMWTLLYTIEWRTCELTLTRFFSDKDRNVLEVSFNLCDNGSCLYFSIKLSETNFIQLSTWKWSNSMSTKSNQTIDAKGVVTRTVFHSYGSGNNGGIVVYEFKKNNRCGDKEFYEVTVAHYFAHSDGTAFNKTESDIGLSLVVKFHPSNGTLIMNWEGPEKHPLAALFYMFDEVNRTGIWKPTMCPHCANRRGRMFWQSDTEDNDRVPRKSRRNNRTATGGAIVGNFIDTVVLGERS